MNKNILMACVILLVCVRCSLKKNYFISDIPFVMDTTMCRAYLDVHQSYNQNEYSKTIASVSQLKRRINEVLSPILKMKIIETPDSFTMNLINDSIWIVKGIQNTKNNYIYFGNEIYIEVCKQNGKIIKVIIGE